MNMITIAVIAVLDAVTPSGIVVGVLLVAPILAASLGNHPRDVAITFGFAMSAYGAATLFGVRGEVPNEMRFANRILIVVALAAAAYLGYLLQQRRLRLLNPSADNPVEVNRLLMSLIVHDLRSPLTTALHTLEYLEQRLSAEEDETLIAEARARLRRNLRLVDAFLAVARADREGAPHPQRSRRLSWTQLSNVLHEEITAFRPEAAGRNKQLLLFHAMMPTREFCIDLLVLRHALTILIDNAVRYALPGRIRVTSTLGLDSLFITVEDCGPGTSSTPASGSGVGLGLQLCSALLDKAGGQLRRIRDEPTGSCFELRMPLQFEEKNHPDAAPTGRGDGTTYAGLATGLVVGTRR